MNRYNDFGHELLCCETVSQDLEMKCEAYPDPVLLKDDRVVDNLLQLEEEYMPNRLYLKNVQSELNHQTRKTVTIWMLQLCTDEHLQEEVFTLATNILDRFLSQVNLPKNQLQVLAAACILIASKLKEHNILDAHKLVYYSDDCFNLDTLKSWELLVLSRLKWDVSAVTPHAFLDHILDRLELKMSSRDLAQIREHASYLIKACATNSHFSHNPPSMVAAAAVASAVQEVVRPTVPREDPKSHPSSMPSDYSNDRLSLQASSSCHYTEPSHLVKDNSITVMNNLYQKLKNITQVDTDCLRETQQQIDNWYQECDEEEQSTAGTPTDVRHVNI